MPLPENSGSMRARNSGWNGAAGLKPDGHRVKPASDGAGFFVGKLKKIQTKKFLSDRLSGSPVSTGMSGDIIFFIHLLLIPLSATFGVALNGTEYWRRMLRNEWRRLDRYSKLIG